MSGLRDGLTTGDAESTAGRRRPVTLTEEGVKGRAYAARRATTPRIGSVAKGSESRWSHHPKASERIQT